MSPAVGGSVAAYLGSLSWVISRASGGATDRGGNSMGWIKERVGFVAGVAAGLAAGLVLVGLLVADSSSGKKHHDAGAAGATSSGPATSPGTGASSTATAGSADPTPPLTAGAVSLDGWKLTLPVDKHGNLSGKAKELQTAAVTAPWLVRNADGSLTFWAPAVGAATSNSEHSRTELVSDSDFAFGRSGVHTLSALLSIGQVPTTARDITIGQIHGGGDLKSIPFVMLHWRDGNIVVIVKQVMHGSTSQSITLLTGVPLNSRFSYSMTDEGNGTLTLSASCNGASKTVSTQVVPAFVGTDERFQVGDYQQATSSSSASDGGRVTFYAIRAS